MRKPTRHELVLLKHIFILVTKEPWDEYNIILDHYTKALENEELEGYKEKLTKYLKDSQNIGDTWVN